MRFQSSPNRGRVGDSNSSSTGSPVMRSFSPLQIEEGSATQFSADVAELLREFQSSPNRGRVGDRGLRGRCLCNQFQSSPNRGRVGDEDVIVLIEDCRFRFSPLQIEEGSATLGLLEYVCPFLAGFQSSPNRGRVGDTSGMIPTVIGDREFQSSPNRGRVGDRSQPTRNIEVESRVCNAQNCTRGRTPRNPRPPVQFRIG